MVISASSEPQDGSNPRTAGKRKHEEIQEAEAVADKPCLCIVVRRAGKAEHDSLNISLDIEQLSWI